MKTKYILIARTLVFLLTILFTFTANAQNNNNLPAEWSFQTTSSNPHGMIVMLEANPRVNDVALLPGDYIGAFFTNNSGELQCAGADVWLGDENIIFPVFGNEASTPEKDGFSYGEQIFFKVFSINNQKTYDVDLLDWDPDYSSNDNWYPLGLSAITNLVSNVEFDAYGSATPNPVCLGDEITLSANIFAPTNGNYSYTWWSVPEGFSSTEANATHTPNVSTSYFLEVSDGVLNSIHELKVPVHEMPIIDAGDDLTICPEGCAPISSTASNYSSIIWITDGDGQFNDAGIASPTYYPGETDAQNGSVAITATVNPLSACNIFASDDVNIIIQPTPSIGISSNIDYCEGQNLTLYAEAIHYSSILWTTDGDGTFSNPNAEATAYVPGPTDLIQDEFTLQICATAVLPLVGQVCKQILVESHNAPSVNAPGSRIVCENLAASINSIAYNYNSILWTSQGDGTFSNAEALHTFYYAGEQDKVNGSATVSVNAFGEGACEVFPATKDILITLKPAPKVDAGENSVLCANQNLELNATVEDFTYFEWTTTGDGSFSNTLITNPTYFPGTNDVNLGNFTLSLSAHPIYPCSAPTVDELQINIVSEPSADILTQNNITYPMGQNLELEAEASDFQSIVWETSGDGTFSNPTSLTPSYTPGPTMDASGQDITLSLTATAATNCGVNASDEITTAFTITASVYAGSDITVCENTISLSASTQFCDSFLWETSGDGTFSNQTSATSDYIPGENDILTGSTELCITGTYGENQNISDCLSISVISNPHIDLGTNQVIACYNETVPLELTIASSYSSILWYTTNGGGMFSSNGNTSTTYNPAPSVDYPQGCIIIYALAQPISPCSMVAEESFEICFFGNPTASAGEDQTITEEETFLPSPSISGSGEISWETSGDGTFDDASNLYPEYFPGNEDILLGSAELKITTLPGAECASGASDQLTLTIFRVHNLIIPEGWSGFSSYIENNIDFDELISPISEDLLVAQSNFGVYWPEGGLNTFGNFENTTGYKFKMSESRVLTLSGKHTSINNMPLNQGWNLIPILTSCYISSDDFISQFGEDLIIIKEIAGNGIIWPAMSIYNIPVFKPGCAYMVALSQSGTLSFDDCGGMKSSYVETPINNDPDSPWNKPEKTTISHTIAFTGIAMENLNEGDFLGAFNENGLCVGRTKIINKGQNIAITVYGDEAITAKNEGMVPGETLSFKVYSQNNETNITVEYSTESANSSDLFTENGLSVVKNIDLGSTSVIEHNASSISCFPNPCKNRITISAEGNFSNAMLSMTDINGRSILTQEFTGTTKLDLSSYPRGFYLLAITGENCNTIEKLILD